MSSSVHLNPSWHPGFQVEEYVQIEEGTREENKAECGYKDIKNASSDVLEAMVQSVASGFEESGSKLRKAVAGDLSGYLKDPKLAGSQIAEEEEKGDMGELLRKHAPDEETLNMLGAVPKTPVKEKTPGPGDGKKSTGKRRKREEDEASDEDTRDERPGATPTFDLREGKMKGKKDLRRVLWRELHPECRRLLKEATEEIALCKETENGDFQEESGILQERLAVLTKVLEHYNNQGEPDLEKQFGRRDLFFALG